MHWVLIIFLTSPGGDFVAKEGEYVMPNKVRCYRAAAGFKDTKDLMGLRYQAKCVQRDAQGMNVGNEALD